MSSSHDFVPRRHGGRMRPGVFSCCLVAVALCHACDPAGTRPPATKTAVGPTPAPAPAACPIERASPLVLQLAVEKRVAIEDAMGLGIAVVAFDCNEVAVVENCQLAGSYEFVGLPRTDVDRRFTSRAQTQAASPLWGKATPPLAIAPGEVLTLKLTTVGQRRATVSRAAKRDLEGNCARATHFVQAAHVGAYALTAKHGTGMNESKAGDLRTCPAATSGARYPEPQCAAALQLELVPIDP